MRKLLIRNGDLTDLGCLLVGLAVIAAVLIVLGITLSPQWR